jgi:thiosulfate/3-mercaptopyruvate sulfurtransferase
MSTSEYAHPEVLVTTEWVAQHLNDPKVRLVEVDVDTTAYDQGHIPGAVAFNWTTQLNDPVKRDIATKQEIEQLLSSVGISNDTTIVLYGDNNNWFAAFAFWLLKIYGHEDVRLMNGGRKKWIEEGRELTTEVPKYEPTAYKAKDPDFSIRADRELIFDTVRNRNRNLVDVRSFPEYTGEIIAPPGMTETAQRGGHIPGAVNIPWGEAVREDGTFKSRQDLEQLYQGKGVTPERETIAYCRIGERSSHTWFVLKYLLGYEKVRNYDGSWTEYGNLIGAPIEKGAPKAAAG